MATKIVTKNSSTASAVPTASDLVQGELAVNVADKRLFTEDNGGSIVELGTNPTTLNVNGTATMEGLVVEPSSATGLTYAADGTNSYINFEANSISDSVQLYAGQSSGGYFSIGTKNSGGTLAERMRIDSSGKLTYGGLSYGVAVDPDGFGGFGSGYNFETNGGSPRHLVTGPVAGQYLSAGSSPFVAWYTGTSVGAGTAAAERMRIDSSGNVGIGCTPSTKLDVAGSGKFQPAIGGGDALVTIAQTNSNAYVHAGIKINAGAANPFYIYQSGSSNTLRFNYNSMSDAGGQMVIDSSGRLGLGVTPEAWSSIFKVLRVGTGSSIAGESGGTSTWFNTNTYYDGSWKRINTNTAAQIAHTSDGKQEFKVAASGSAGSAISWNTAMTVDNSGNLLVGKTAADNTTAGTRIHPAGYASFTIANDYPIIANRLSSDGDIAVFRKNNTTVGSIGNYGGLALDVGKGTTAVLRFRDSLNAIYPAAGVAGGTSDGVTSLGISSGRFNDIYATNGTIQTSDFNEKQDIAELSDAEQRVAVACKGLLRKFRWKSSVAEKGDEARTHFGIIAQDLQAAFAAEGLDAGDYAMFISSTWTDEETNEEKTRMGVRYSELLAFIIAAI